MQIYYVYFHDTRFVPIHASEIINELERRGHEIHVFTSIRDETAKKKLSAREITLHNLRTIEARFVSELVFMAILLPYLLFQALISRPDVIYTRHSAVSSVATLIAKLLRKPCLIEINDIVLDKLKFSSTPIIKRKWIQLYQSVNFRLASLLLPVTEQIGLWLKLRHRVNRRKVAVIPNGVNVHRFSPKPQIEARDRYHIPRKTRVILSLGSLFPWAGTETLIAAAPGVLEKFPDTLFVIGSGEEPYLGQLKEQVDQSGLKDHFLFFGFIPWDDASWFISSSDICVAPFIFKDIRSGISSLRVLSYLACGRPVVGSDIPGLGDMLERETIGLSFPMGDHGELSKAIINLLANRRQLKVMGDRCREFAIKNYSWEIIVDRLEALFEALIGIQDR